MTLTLGDIKESYMPAAIFDEELSILNTKITVYSKLTDSNSLEDMLQSQKELHFLKQQISHKYSSMLMAHTIMKYATNHLFKLNDEIDRINDLAEIAFKQKEFIKTKKDNLFHILVGFVSMILSTSIIFDYIINPIYKIRHSQEMVPRDTILNYLILIGSSSVVFFVLYFIIFQNKRNKK